MFNDTLKSALLYLVTSVFAALVLLHILNWNADQISSVNLVVQNALLVLFLVLNRGAVVQAARRMMAKKPEPSTPRKSSRPRSSRKNDS
jgi:heme A synthase